MNKRTFAVFLSEDYIRDAQAADSKNADPMDDDWHDISGNLLLGFEVSDTRNDAKKQASTHYNYEEDMLLAIEVVNPY